MIWLRRLFFGGGSSASASGQSQKSTRSYSVGLVGESKYQNTIRKISVRDAVMLVLEPENRHDNRAIAAHVRGEIIGYIPRDSWLKSALIDERKPFTAALKRIAEGERGVRGVTLEITIGTGQQL